MNRKEEYVNLLKEISDAPPTLEKSVVRGRRKASAMKVVRNLFMFPAGTAASLFIAFALLVNVSAGFAGAVSEVPVFRALAAGVQLPFGDVRIEYIEYSDGDGDVIIGDITDNVRYEITDAEGNIIYEGMSFPNPDETHIGTITEHGLLDGIEYIVMDEIEGTFTILEESGTITIIEIAFCMYDCCVDRSGDPNFTDRNKITYFRNMIYSAAFDEQEGIWDFTKMFEMDPRINIHVVVGELITHIELCIGGFK
jgi:hypothetical protein